MLILLLQKGIPFFLSDYKLRNIVLLLKKVKKSVLLKNNIEISQLVSLHIIILVTKLGKIFMLNRS